MAFNNLTYDDLEIIETKGTENTIFKWSERMDFIIKNNMNEGSFKTKVTKAIKNGEGSYMGYSFKKYSVKDIYGNKIIF